MPNFSGGFHTIFNIFLIFSVAFSLLFHFHFFSHPIPSLLLSSFSLIFQSFLRASTPLEPYLVDREDPDSGDLRPGDWRQDQSSNTWLDFSPICSNNFNSDAKAIRDEFRSYFNTEGAVPWQWRQCSID